MRAPRRMVTEGTIPVTRKDYQPDREGPNAISLSAGRPVAVRRISRSSCPSRLPPPSVTVADVVPKILNATFLVGAPRIGDHGWRCVRSGSAFIPALPLFELRLPLQAAFLPLVIRPVCERPIQP